MIYDETKIYAYKIAGIARKLHKLGSGYAFVVLDDSHSYANGVDDSAQECIRRSSRTNKIEVFENYKDFISWIGL